jgi:hypothetical protein
VKGSLHGVAQNRLGMEGTLTRGRTRRGSVSRCLAVAASSPSSVTATASSGGRPSKARCGATPEDSGGASCPGSGSREVAEWLGVGS